MTPATVDELDAYRAEVYREVVLEHFARRAMAGEAPPTQEEASMFVAKAFREADARAGLVTVSKAVTREMAEALDHTPMGDLSDDLAVEWQPVWEAALAASPFAGEGGE